MSEHASFGCLSHLFSNKIGYLGPKTETFNNAKLFFFRSRQFKDRKKGWLDDRKTLRRYVEAEYVEAELFTTPIHDQYKVVCILTHLLHFYFLFYHLFRLFSRDSIRGYVRLSVGLSVSPSVTLSSNRNWRIRSWQNGLLGATGCTHGVLVRCVLASL